MGICDSKANNAYQKYKSETDDIIGIGGVKNEIIPLEKAEPIVKS